MVFGCTVSRMLAFSVTVGSRARRHMVGCSIS
jgi:hypothetical protein